MASPEHTSNRCAPAGALPISTGSAGLPEQRPVLDVDRGGGPQRHHVDDVGEHVQVDARDRQQVGPQLEIQ
jgi:hypothetical protein